MSVPMRKNEPELEENLTTEDLAKGKRPAATEDRTADRIAENQMNDDRPRPILAQRTPGQTGQTNVSTGPGNENRGASDVTPLFPNNELEDLRSRWSNIQTAFVDEPRSAVEQADGLVAAAMKRLAEIFAQERSNLEQQWGRGDNVSTEDLRIALQRYRSFFQRLLSI